MFSSTHILSILPVSDVDVSYFPIDYTNNHLGISFYFLISYYFSLFLIDQYQFTVLTYALSVIPPPLPLHPYAFYLYGKQRLKLIIWQLRWVFLEQNFLREHLSLRKIVRVPLADIFIDSCWIFSSKLCLI